MNEMISFEGEGSRPVADLCGAGCPAALVVVSGFAEIGIGPAAAVTVGAGQALVLPGAALPDVFSYCGEGVLFCDAELDAQPVLPGIVLLCDDLSTALVRRVLLGAGKSSDHRRAAFRLLCYQLAEARPLESSAIPGAVDTVAMLTWLEQHLDEPLTLEMLAVHFGCSRTTVLNRFREDVGRSPMRLLADKRVQYARRALEQTERSVTDIARSVGYTDQPSFTRFIKNQTGHAPTELRRRARWVV